MSKFNLNTLNVNQSVCDRTFRFYFVALNGKQLFGIRNVRVESDQMLGLNI